MGSFPFAGRRASEGSLPSNLRLGTAWLAYAIVPITDMVDPGPYPTQCLLYVAPRMVRVSPGIFQVQKSEPVTSLVLCRFASTSLQILCCALSSHRGSCLSLSHSD
jgi:hypothetical protein